AGPQPRAPRGLLGDEAAAAHCGEVATREDQHRGTAGGGGQAELVSSSSRDSHFGVAARRAGCITIRCQSRACMDSVWAVTLLGTTVGTRMQASDRRRNAPPSRPTTPVTKAPTSRAF